MGIAVVALIILIFVAIVAILILSRVFAEAVKRNPNRPGNKKSGDDQREE